MACLPKGTPPAAALARCVWCSLAQLVLPSVSLLGRPLPRPTGLVGRGVAFLGGTGAGCGWRLYIPYGCAALLRHRALVANPPPADLPNAPSMRNSILLPCSAFVPCQLLRGHSAAALHARTALTMQGVVPAQAAMPTQQVAGFMFLPSFIMHPARIFWGLCLLQDGAHFNFMARVLTPCFACD